MTIMESYIHFYVVLCVFYLSGVTGLVFWMSGLIFLMSGLVLWMSGLVLWMSGLAFWVFGLAFSGVWTCILGVRAGGG